MVLCVSTALSAGCPSAWDASFTLGMGPAVALVEAFLMAHVFTILCPVALWVLPVKYLLMHFAISVADIFLMAFEL